MMMHNKAATQEEPMAITSEWWDIDNSPVPSGCDAHLVGPSIKRASKSLGYSGPLYMTAIGKLTDTPEHVLRALSSTGITLKFDPSDITGIGSEMLLWTWSSKPPANVMLISGEEIFNPTLASLRFSGYNILQAYPYLTPYRRQMQWIQGRPEDRSFWSSAVRRVNLPGSSQFAIFLAKALRISPRTHLNSKEHEQEMVDLEPEAA